MGSSCYTIVPNRLSRSHAEYVCKHRGGHLFHVANAGENLFFYILLSSRFNHSVWMGMHATMLLRFSSCIPVLILKSQRLKISQTNNCSQINKFFVPCPLKKLSFRHEKHEIVKLSLKLESRHEKTFDRIHTTR